MSEMSYCQFENTYSSLRGCYKSLAENKDLSDDEEKYKEKLLQLCQDMINSFTEYSVYKESEEE